MLSALGSYEVVSLCNQGASRIYTTVLRWQEYVLTPYQEGAAVARGGAAGQRRLLDTRDRQEQVVSACPSEAVNLSTYVSAYLGSVVILCSNLNRH
jgi:Fe-S-cluster-containing hydrogenase component 2